MAITLKWSDAYCVDGNIDTEHKRLFELANQVFALIDPSRQVAELKDTINALYQYMEFHFGNEERLLRRVGFVGYHDHVRSHQAIIAEMNRVMKTSRDLDTLGDNLRHLMLDWVLTHVLREDRKIAAYTKRPAAQPAVAEASPAVPEVAQNVQAGLPT